MTSSNRSRVFWIVLAVAAIAYSVVWPQAPRMVSDSPGYVEVATDLRDFRLDTLHDRTLGYPLLMLATGASTRPSHALYFVQLGMHLASTILGVWLLRRLGTTPKWLALFVAIALAPPSVALACSVLTEELTAFLLMAGTTAMLAWIWDGRRAGIAIACLAFGWVGWVRPTYLLLGIALAVACLAARVLFRAQRRRLDRMAIALMATTAVFGGGLLAYNAQHFGFSGATPLFGFSLSTRTVRFVERLPDEQAAVREILVEARDRNMTREDAAHTGVMSIWGARSDLQAATGLSYPDLSQYMTRLNLLLIRKAPLEYLLEVGRASVSYVFPYVPELASFGSRSLQLLWSVAQFVLIGLWTMHLVALVGLGVSSVVLPPVWRGLRSLASPRASGAVMLTLIIVTILAYTLLVSTWIEVGNPRYRAPTDLLMAMGTVLGLQGWIAAWHRTRSMM